jgi:hypothetical protein
LEEIALLTVPEFSVAAHDGGETTFLNVEVWLSEAVSSVTAVDFTIEGITATPIDDYFLTGANPGVFSSTITFGPFATLATFTITAVDDTQIENAESLRVVLSNPSGASLSAAGSDDALIIDDDGNLWPEAAPIGDQYRWVHDTTDLEIDLPLYFSDADHSLSQLSWTVTPSGTPGLSSHSIDPATHILHLNMASGVAGVTNITVRATDPRGAYDESNFEVWSVAVTDFLVERQLENEQWIEETGDLWGSDVLQWRPIYAPSPLPASFEVAWRAKPWELVNDPSVAWGSFAASASQDQFAPGNPGIGIWAIRPEILLPGSAPATMVAAQMRRDFSIVGIQFEGIQLSDGATNLFPTGEDEWGFFYGRNGLDTALPIHDEVNVVVDVTPPSPGAIVYLKDVDVDDPSAFQNAVDNELLPIDNRGPAGVFPGAGVTNANGRVTVKFKPSKAPGDNYRIVAAGRDVVGTVLGYQPVDSPLPWLEDGAVFVDSIVGPGANLKWDAGEGLFDHNYPLAQIWHASPMLTVWRKLGVEVDAMGAPPESETFDAAPPVDDPKPGALPTPDVSGLQGAFADAFIWPEVISAFSTNDLKFKKTFASGDEATRYFINGGLAGYPDAPYRGSRNESDDYWTVYIASVYEGLATEESLDNDANEETANVGLTFANEPEFSLILQEVIRDVAVEHGWNAGQIAAVQLQVVVHEIGHHFELLHDADDAFLSNVMRAPMEGVASEEADMWRIPLVFKDEDLAIIRSHGGNAGPGHP